MSELRLLILSCSQRKRTDAKPLPAVERYDGPAYRVLRKYARGAEPPATWVLSAEYGLIPANQPIPHYDRRMTGTRAKTLRSQVSTALRTLRAEGYAEALVCAGQTYTAALGDVSEQIRCPVAFTRGSLGRHLALLRDWLYEAPPDVPTVLEGNPVVFRGRPILSDAEAVVRLARERAIEDPVGAGRYAAWYVPVGALRVAPKWLVSALTGMPVSDFRTADARQVLTALGVEVHRA